MKQLYQLTLSVTLALSTGLFSAAAQAQHTHNPEPSATPKPTSKTRPSPQPSAASGSHQMNQMEHHHMGQMDHHEIKHGSTSDMHAGMQHDNPITMQLMQRAQGIGSGTSVIPPLSPMRMWSLETGNWLWMFHGDLVGGYNYQGGPRGAQAWAGENWEMAMGSGWVGPGILDLRLMTSLEALSLPPGGTPELFQTGETYQGKPLFDKQHPHDLLMEFAARYTYKPTDDLSLFAYAGLAGEPALGPSAFMHRASAADNHWAPLSHHLQDSTHVSFGVGTLGARWKMLQLEASLFNGREPDENRFNIDFGPLDSWSTRLSWIPSDNWTAQLSYGQLKDPESLEPGNVYRTTASVSNVQTLGPGLLSSSLIWGMNQENHAGPQTLHGFGLESQYDWDTQRNHVYGRLEVVDKNALALTGLDDHSLHKITALTLGGVRELDWFEQFDLGIGADASVYFADADVRKAYGDIPLGFRVYLRLRPPTMEHMAEMSPKPEKPMASPKPIMPMEHHHMPM